MCFLTPPKEEVKLPGNDIKSQTTETPVKSEPAKFPVFAKWKGEEAQDMLRIMWEVSGGDKAFILTMTGENGSWNPYLKHPKQNSNGTWDHSFGLNSAYHKPFIDKIHARQVSLKEIAEYHYNIYKKRPGAYYAYYKRNNANITKQILFP